MIAAFLDVSAFAMLVIVRACRQARTRRVLLTATASG
jgi:hypothetical protein